MKLARAVLLVFLGLCLWAGPISDAGAPDGVSHPGDSGSATWTPSPADGHAPLSGSVERAFPAVRGELGRLAQSARTTRLGSAPRLPKTRPPISARRLQILEQARVLRANGVPFEIAGIEHRPLRPTKAGLPILNRPFRAHFEKETVVGTTGRLGAPVFARPDWRFDRGEVLEIATKAVPGRLRAEARAERGWLATSRETVPAWRVLVPTVEPFGSWEVAIDARSGQVLWSVDRLLAVDGSGAVHDQNPLEAPVPSTVALSDLDGSGLLSGSYVRIHDLNAPDAYNPGLEFDYPSDDPRLVQASVYWTATRAARSAVSRGFPTATFPLISWVNLRTLGGDEYNNAFYDPGFQLLVFGNGDGSVVANLGTDADVAAHEMGHHIFETLVQPQIQSVSDPAAAMHEGFADTWAAIVNGDPRIGESVLPGSSSLREIQTNRSFPDDDFPDDPHTAGLIYASTSWDLVGRIGAKKVRKILMAGLPFLPPDPVPLDFRAALLKGDKAATKGRNRKAIKKVTKAHGFPATDLGSEYQGNLEDGVTEVGALDNDDYVFWSYTVPPGATSVRITMTGTNDADLFVVGPDTDPDIPSTYLSSAGPGSNETLTVTTSTQPSVNDLALAVLIADYPHDGRGSQYQMSATATIGPEDLTLDGPAAGGTLVSLDQIDFFTFTADAGEYVRVDVASQSPGLDLIAVVVDSDLETLAYDDDSGPGLDPLIQGAPIPAAGRYAVAVLAWFDDVNPVRSLGSYTVAASRCANLGTDTDGDGASDSCDDDDDNDGFEDSLDTAALDPLQCFDIEADGCDDCSSGVFDPFADGPDADSDSVCDQGDIDDDSDGCPDVIDPFPLTPSTDDDLDFVSSDCDVCPLVVDPAQLDSDADGLGDRCSSCNLVDWTAPVADPPDQNPRDPKLTFKNPKKPGKQDVTIVGQFNPAAPALGVSHESGALLGAHVRLEDARGAQFDLNLPGAFTPGCDPGDGWITVDGFTSKYQNVSGALPPTCAPGSAGDLTSVTLYDTQRESSLRSNAIGYVVKIDNTALPFKPQRRPTGLRFTLALGNQFVAGFASPEAQAGWCSEINQIGAGLKCRKVLKNGVLKKIICK